MKAPTSMQAETFRRLRERLLKCGPFDSNSSVRALFSDPRLATWRAQVADASSPAVRVDVVIDLLIGRERADGTPALLLLLLVLRDRTDPADLCHSQLEGLLKDVCREIGVPLAEVLTLTSGNVQPVSWRQRVAQHPLLSARWLLALVAFMIFVTLFWLLSGSDLAATPTPAGDSFPYLVNVQDAADGSPLANAHVTIEITDGAPLDAYAGDNGVARLLIPADLLNTPGRLIVTAPGYQPFREEIDLRQGQLPDTVQLTQTGS